VSAATVERREDEAAAQRWALLAGRVAVGIYLLELLLNLTRPHLQDGEPSITILQRLPAGSGSFGRLFTLPPLVFWLVLVGIVAGLVLQVVAARYPAEGPQARALTWATLAALLGPFALIPLTVILTFPLIALACVPSTAFVLLLLHHVQQYARVPFRALLAAFGWGALIASGLTRACNGLFFGALNGYLGRGDEGDLTSYLQSQYRAITWLVLHMSVLTVVVQAAGIALLLVLLRHRVVDVVTGIVVGAAVGLGVTFSESIVYIKIFGLLGPFNGASPGFEYWIRQSVTLLTGPVAFGAVLGAALGIAATLRDERQRRRVAAFGLLAAIGANVANESLTGWLSHALREPADRGGALDTLVVSPLFLLLVQAPFVVVVVLLLRDGLRRRAVAARTAAEAEVATRRGAVTSMDEEVLTNPALRLWLTVVVWRGLDRDRALRLRRLHAAQRELVGLHWPGRDPAPDTELDRLRAEVMPLRSALPNARETT
jgi:RsiW-degrading membrane proteinase PrsW (M82 family)